MLMVLVTLVSVLMAIVMGLIAWRTAREERRRSEARAAALASDIRRAVAASAVGMRGEPGPRAVAAAPRAGADLFASPSASSSSSRPMVVVGVGLVVFATAAALAVVFSSGARRTPPPPAKSLATPETPESPAATATPAGGANVVPLELVALGQERRGEELIVRGVVRNPPAGVRVDRMTAVVFLFDRDGGFLTSGRAAVESATLAPGGESTFLVTVPHAGAVSRYRVSFRTDAGIVPHVDRRVKS